MGAPLDKGPTKSDNIGNNNLDENTRHNVAEDEIKEEGGIDDEHLTLEDLAPDGGWGWMVALGMIVVFITSVGPAPSFSIVYGEFLESTGRAGSAMTILNSVFNISFSIAGVMTNYLIKRFSMRSVGVVGALLYSVPNVLAALVRYFHELAASFLIQGIGLGLMFTILNTNFNAFFVKKRAMVMSASQAVIGLGWIVYPIFIEKMMKLYGFRGTAAINGALSLNCIVGMTMMHPVQWYVKLTKKHQQLKADEDIKSPELQELIAKSKRRSTIDYIHMSKNSSRWNSLRSLKEYGDKDIPLFCEIAKQIRVSSASDVEKGSVDHKKKPEQTGYDTPAKVLALTLSSSSLANLRMPVGMDSLGNGSLAGEMERRKSNARLKKILMTSVKENTSKGVWSDVIDMTLIRNKGFINMCLGMSIAFMSDFTFLSLLPLIMAHDGYSKTDASLAVTISATADLVSRISLAIFTVFVNCRPRYIFFSSMVCMSLAKIGFMCFEKTLTGTLLMVAAIGIVRSWFLVQPLVVVEDVPVEKFAAAYGIFAIISGVISTVFGTSVGFIRDWTDSYILCQIILVGLNIIFTVPWVIQFASEWLRKKT